MSLVFEIRTTTERMQMGKKKEKDQNRDIEVERNTVLQRIIEFGGFKSQSKELHREGRLHKSEFKSRKSCFAKTPIDNSSRTEKRCRRFSERSSAKS